MALLLLGMGAVAFGSLPAASKPNSSLQELSGIWGGEKRFGPAVRGPLLLIREPSKWRVEVAGERSEAQEADGTITCEVPGGGTLRVSLGSGTGALEGQWIQPATVSMFGQRFSTPVRFEKVGTAVWRGVVQPLEDRLRLFVVLQSDSTGGLRAWLRNPESNFGRFFSVSRLQRDGERIDFWGRPAGQPKGEEIILFSGLYHRDAGALSAFLDGLGGTFDLERIDPDASSFFPRPWARGTYEYEPPVQKSDGWETAGLQSVGMAIPPIERLIQKIITTPMDGIDAPAIDALLVARQGKLVVEEYFHGQSGDETHDTRSASKSLTTTMVGAAIHAGALSLDQKVYESMSDGRLPLDLDPRAARMTIRHLITMSSGLACDDWDGESPGGEDRMQNQSEQQNWYRYTLDLPMQHEPGEHAAYCSGGMNLAGGVLARAAGMPLTDFFERYLARPLQMGIYHTNLMPTGEAYAGGGLRVTARDFLKFGQLMLNDGQWNGRRILDEGWAKAAWTKWFELGSRRPEGYGYGWWLFDYELDGERWPAFYAGGNGGNYIICVPRLDLAIVFFASNYNQSVMHETKYQYVPEFILRSIVEGASGDARR